MAERRPRALKWLWTEFGPKGGKVLPRAAGPTAQNPWSNIIGPTYGVYNMPSDLAEISRLVEGIGAEINMVFPLGSHLDDVRKLADAGTPISVSIANSDALLCESLDRPYLQAPIGIHSTTAFLRSLGDMLGLDPEPFILREKAYDP